MPVGLDISQEERFFAKQFEQIAKENGIVLHAPNEPLGKSTRRIMKFRRHDNWEIIFSLLGATEDQKQALSAAFSQQFPEATFPLHHPLQHSILVTEEGRLCFMQHLDKQRSDDIPYPWGVSGKFKLGCYVDDVNTIVGIKVQKPQTAIQQKMLILENRWLKRLGQLLGFLSRVDKQTIKAYSVIKRFEGCEPDNDHRPTHVTTFFCSLLANLRYIHQHGLLHRDIKCSNMIMDTNSDVVFIDYGHTCDAGMASNGGMLEDKMVGTINYSPHPDPKIARRSHYAYGYSTDIYSTGMVLKKLYGPDWSDMPRDLIRICQKMLKNPIDEDDYLKTAEVYQNAQEIMDDLPKKYRQEIEAAYQRLEQILSDSKAKKSESSDMDSSAPTLISDIPLITIERHDGYQAVADQHAQAKHSARNTNNPK